ncbi:response regulator [Mucilaginibacter sp. SMC90]|uniref:hybrid sensor histidine kinase/response regulator transcription factor n=1 Tax=Mucilaginibacter sp. SMC90 TaxID=2929803 RepID=UPI001FB3DF33|nr:hybrid sensor histidine kinase/response regulator transcription factor [Mucilaginibacter sp. SMC90]UOE47452.1 response regulator [Mucilaginibacter sp. SMC90]
MKRTFYYCLLVLLIPFSSVFGQDFSFRKVSADNGLSHNTVYTILQDAKGFLWFGTREGLNRYDGYTVKNYFISGSRPGSSANRISSLLYLNSNIYIGTDNGLYRYDEQLDKIDLLPLTKIPLSVQGITAVGSSVYIGTNNGFYQIKDEKTIRLPVASGQSITAVTALAGNRFLLAASERLFIADKAGRHLKTIIAGSTAGVKADFTIFNICHEKNKDWLCSNQGLFMLDENNWSLSKIKFTADESTESNTVRAISRSVDNKLMIGTENGLYAYDEKLQQSVNYGQSFDNNPKKLNDKAIYSAFTAKDGSVWLGTYFGGVNYIPSVSYGFGSILASEQSGHLNGKAVSQLMEDKHHQIWIATEDGGISLYNTAKQTFTNINVRSSPFFLNINNVHAIYDDRAGSIWAGTFLGGLHRFNLQTQKTTIYTNRPGDTTSLCSNQVYAVLRDSVGILWIGTQHGLNTFDYHTNRFKPFKPELFTNEFIYDIAEGKSGELWFCTRWDGLLRYERKTGKITRYKATRHKGDLPGNQVISIYKDSRQTLWFGTLDGGVCAYDPANDNFKVLNTDNGLPNNNVYGILEDDDHQYWFSTNHGLSCYNPQTHQFVNYDSRYGLPSNQFNFKSFLKSSDGNMYFGTVHGLCYFNPQLIKAQQPRRVPLVFTGFQLFNDVLTPDDKGPLPRQIDNMEAINLDYAQNIFGISYAALNYSNVRAVNYAYYLEGFEKKWNFVGNKSIATYTSLPPGKYTFHVMALDVSGKALGEPRRLVIHIAPPFYRTTFAYLIYLALILAAIVLYTRFISFLNAKELEIQLERLEKEKTAALTQHKLNFFTFISHEFKTPLTLIIASAEKFMERHKTGSGKTSELSVIKNNASRLFNMIQQLMEFRTIETEHTAIKLSRNDFVKFVKHTTEAFNTLSHDKGIQLNVTASTDNYNCYFDADKVEKIISNILSNAIKNTAEGQIHVELSFETTANGSVNSTILITDTGKGMTATELENIFLPFYKSADSNTGSGVGMALVKSLVAYLGGEVTISSYPGKGTCVKLVLPIEELTGSDVYEVKVDDHEPALPPTVVNQSNGTIHTILVAEDNRELLAFLADHLGSNYKVIQASNGQMALNKLLKQIPDLVISDIRMPRMDGIELCRKIKTDETYNHIPVILLSDATREHIKMDGLDVGADAYLAKPFNLKEMDLMIANMIKSRVKLREQLLDMSKFGLDKLPRNNKDQEFLSNLGVVLEDYFADPQFSVEQMASELHISRTLLHLNLKKILDKSANQLLNDYRLKKAVLMLKKSLPINEVAYYCGYSDPNYFSRIFKKTYGTSPGSFRTEPEKYPEIC